MLAYLDIGLGLYALLLLQSVRTIRKASRTLEGHPLLVVYTAVLISASLWPLIIIVWLLTRGGDHD